MIRARTLAILAFALPGCDRSAGPSGDVVATPTTTTKVRTAAAPSPPVTGLRFRDATATSGITFVYDSGLNAQKDYPTSLGSGVAMIDYDGDGKLDLYFCCARAFPLAAESKAMGNRLYRNIGGLKFEDVTDKAKVGYRGFCHGAAVGDVNGDGKPDMYLTTYGGNVLYLNNGDGTFRDASKGSGTDIGPWSTGAAFLDYDGDGKLDLYVSRYGQWTEDGPHEYRGDKQRGLRIIESAYSIKPEPHVLFKGRGDGTFEDVTVKAGVFRRDGRGLGVVAADVNHDGWPDLYVANDASPNFLFLNKKDGTFEDATESSGAARDGAGKVQGSMGVDIQDVDGDGRPELFVTNFRGESNTLYQNLDGRNFQDVSARAGIVKDSLAYVKWGCALADFDNDGKPDMFVVNGDIDDNLREFGQDSEFAQPVIVWKNVGRGRFARVTDPGPFFAINHPARGAAFGDLDDDGDLDVVIVRMDLPPAILANESPDTGNWVRFSLQGTKGNPDAIGATVEVHAGGQVFQRLIRGGDSYLSVNDRRALIGLGAISAIDKVEILWPGGRTTTLKGADVALKRTHAVVQPSGDAP
jgi:enediyne biosynthesis protein E4